MKKILSLILLLSLCLAVLVGCGESAKLPDDTQAVTDYDYAFVGRWTRQAEHDEETIRFGADGSFTYSCACGNPVNDADLCEGYTYDEKTETITLNCIEETDEMVTSIKVVECDENTLKLDFDGDVRIFTK